MKAGGPTLVGVLTRLAVGGAGGWGGHDSYTAMETTKDNIQAPLVFSVTVYYSIMTRITNGKPGQYSKIPMLLCVAFHTRPI